MAGKTAYIQKQNILNLDSIWQLKIFMKSSLQLKVQL